MSKQYTALDVARGEIDQLKAAIICSWREISGDGTACHFCEAGAPTVVAIHELPHDPGCIAAYAAGLGELLSDEEVAYANRRKRNEGTTP